ncbi:Cytoplasmic tRNA 2-thiolation protein 1 [Histomonas meleagridis]|uniref:Cytoplasmic tRNA 2-thiolation protein 1 n=1 Tax=Histomonas meleagridis TaxID=135588 RepID=UPI00355A5AD3|nr:Cytoplasmic tRNA 2-thiolation protein 1 [Histomonas meleagridis]KAH0801521.1 Cytoplasmic tRNA 2-thiolation protein 1 [Histomonas meleagridis]
MVLCQHCQKEKAQIVRPETGEKLCKSCFSTAFEDEVYHTIQRFNLIEKGDVVAIGVSGGKDSTVLMHILNAINIRYNMGFEIQLVCIDEGITGYRDNALQTVKQNSEAYNLPLTILSFTDIFGWTLDQIFQATQTRETCTYCGIFRRRALDIGAQRVNATKVAVGHNADDIAETVILNVLRGDVSRYGRSVDIKTDGIDSKLKGSSIAPRIKPFAFQNQKEIVYYAHFNKLLYYAVECTYAVQAFRRFPREYLVAKQQKDPGVMRRIIEGAIMYQQNIETEPESEAEIGFCKKCGAACNHDICMACRLLEKLEAGHAKKDIVEEKE